MQRWRWSTMWNHWKGRKKNYTIDQGDVSFMLDFCTADHLMGLVDGCVDCDGGGVQLRCNDRASRNKDAKPRLAEIHLRRTPTYLSMQFLRSRLSGAAFSPGPLCEKPVDGEGQSRQGRASLHGPHRTYHSLTHNDRSLSEPRQAFSRAHLPNAASSLARFAEHPLSPTRPPAQAPLVLLPQSACASHAKLPARCLPRPRYCNAPRRVLSALALAARRSQMVLAGVAPSTLCNAPIVDSPTLRSIILPIGYPGTSLYLRLPRQLLAATSIPLRQCQPNGTQGSREPDCFCILMEVSAF